jgi:hypothetical protein
MSEEKTVDLKMTPEIEEKLKKYRGYLPGNILTWTPDIYRLNTPKSEWPVFKYKTRTSFDIAKDADDLLVVNVGGAVSSNGNSRMFDITRRQTVEFSNYKDSSGNEIACEKDENGEIKKECWEKINFGLIEEYMSAINNESHLSEEEIRGLES